MLSPYKDEPGNRSLGCNVTRKRKPHWIELCDETRVQVIYEAMLSCRRDQDGLRHEARGYGRDLCQLFGVEDVDRSRRKIVSRRNKGSGPSRVERDSQRLDHVKHGDLGIGPRIEYMDGAVAAARNP